MNNEDSSNNLLGESRDEESKEEEPSEIFPSFNFVAMKNSIMFCNLEKEDLKKFPELEKSSLPYPDKQKIKINERKVNRNISLSPLNVDISSEGKESSGNNRSPLMNRMLNHKGIMMQMIPESPLCEEKPKEILEINSADLPKKKEKKKSKFKRSEGNEEFLFMSYQNQEFELEKNIRRVDEEENDKNNAKIANFSVGDNKMRFDSLVNLSNKGASDDSEQSQKGDKTSVIEEEDFEELDSNLFY